MRIEKGFAAMGHELDGDTSPIECGLDMMVAKAGQFIGSDALAKRRQIPTAKLRGPLPRATFEDPRNGPTGMPHVIVNGNFVVRDSVHTHARAGRALRRGRE